MGCDGERGVDVETEDKLNLLEQGKYYGHANRKRGASDSRQCTWRSPDDPSDSGYTAPMIQMPSSSCGLIEFHSNHFGGEMRGNLIASKYTGPLYRIILNSDGSQVVPESNPPIKLVGDDGLDVTQAPNGALLEVRLIKNELYVHEPFEPATSELTVHTVFPHRGPQSGGSTLHVYGKNLDEGGNPSVTVGGKNCPITERKEHRIACTLPNGNGAADVVVTAGGETSTFAEGYRYIVGS